MAQSAYDFYAYWNGEAVADLWTMIAAMTSTDDYRVLLTAVILIGFLGALLGAALKNRGADAIVWFATTIVILSIAFVPRVTITVKDNHAGYAQAVQNVPIGIAWPASITSRISWWMTQTFETAFNDVDAAKYSRFGVAFPQRAVTAVMGMGAVTESGQAAVRAVAERCIIPEILDNPAKRQAILKAADINTLIASEGWVNPARRVLFEGNVITCKEAIPQLSTLLETVEIPEMQKVLVAKLDVSGDDLSRAGLLAALPGAEERMLGVSRTLSQSLKQSVMLSALPEAMLSSAAKAGKAPLTTGVAIARAQGNLASEINYRALSEMAKSALPKVRNVLEFVVIALFPIVFVIMVGMGLAGMAIARSYMTLLISVGLWAPITAIINYLTIHVDAEPINRLVEASGGVTLSAATLIREAGASSQAMAGSLMWLVPVLAYAVAKGSDMAVTQMASSVLAPASSAAQAQGSSIAMGNVSAGNASVGNVSANNMSGNKTDMSSSYATPEKHAATTAYGSYQGSMATGAVTGMTVAKTDLGINTSGSHLNSATNVRSEGSNHVDSFTTGKVRNAITTHTAGDIVTGGRIDSMSAANSNAHTDGTSLATNVTYGTDESVSNSTDMARGGSSAESVAIDSTGGAMLNGVMKNTSGDLPINAAQGSSIDLSSVSLTPPPTGNLSNLLIPSVTLNGKPNSASKVPTAQNHAMTDSLSLGTRINFNTQADKNDSARQSMSTQSRTNLMVNDVSGQNHSGVIQKNIADSDQATRSSQQVSNLSESKSDGTQVTDANSDQNSKGQSFNESNGASMNTTVSMDTLARDEALRTWGGASEALEALVGSSDTREAFGRHVNSMASQYDPTASITSQVSNQEPRSPLAPRNLKNEHRANSAGIDTVYESSARAIQDDSGVKLDESRVFRPAITQEENDNLLWQRGLGLAVSAAYQDRETGVKSVTSRSYLFGMTYNSVDDLRQKMIAKSNEDPNFRQALIYVGNLQNSRGSTTTIETSEILKRLEKED